MTKISNPITLIIDYISQSVNRMVMVTFIFVLLLPLAFLLPNLNMNIWDNIQKENLVKHELLATTLVEPIKMHITSYQSKLQSLGNLLSMPNLDKQKIKKLLDGFANSSDANVVALTLLLAKEDSTQTSVNKEFLFSSTDTSSLKYIVMENKYRKYDEVNSISSVVKSTLSNKPVILIKHHILDERLDKFGTLIAEVGLGFIQDICGKISFGDTGHCVVVDNKGRVVAHQNESWVSQIKNLSSEKIVKHIQKAGMGTFEYYSSLNKAEMIAGFAKVDKLDWGVMVLQPKAEADVPFGNILTEILGWVVMGIVLALLIAFVATQKITQSLNVLVAKAKELDLRSESFRLGETPTNYPSEIADLWNILSIQIVNYQAAKVEVKNLNTSLNQSSSKDLHKMIAEIRDRNLKKIKNKDELTGITNKTCFDEELNRSLIIHKNESIGVILVEIENYKQLLSHNGEDIGEFVIQHVAQILNQNIRGGDIVAHYGDAEQFALYINKCNLSSLHGTAEKMKTLVETSPALWNEEVIYITLSTGVVIDRADRQTVNSLMENAQQALIRSKPDGKNQAFSRQSLVA